MEAARKLDHEDSLTSLEEARTLEAVADRWVNEDPLYKLVRAIESRRDRGPSAVNILATPPPE